MKKALIVLAVMVMAVTVQAKSKKVSEIELQEQQLTALMRQKQQFIKQANNCEIEMIKIRAVIAYLKSKEVKK